MRGVSANPGVTPDCSPKDCWFRIPEITRDMDTFYICSTVHMGANGRVEFSGPVSFHQDDYSIFFNNVKGNVAKRIAACKEMPHNWAVFP